MPKGKGKRGADRQGKGKRKASPKRSEDNLDLEDDEAMSVTSQTSLDTKSGGEEISPAETYEDGPEEIEVNFEQSLDENLDGATQKSAKGRQMSLSAVRKALRSKLISECVANRKITIQDCIERCLKRGQTEDRVLASSIASLLCIQLGFGEDSENAFKSLKPLLITVIQDPTVSPLARASCCTSLGLCCFIACDEVEDFEECCNVLLSIFNTNKTVQPAQVQLHCSALLAWGLLLSIATNAESLVNLYLKRVTSLLQSSDINLRIAAGEVLALMCEIGRCADEDFEGDQNGLCDLLKELATDSDRHKAKKDLRQQRSSFRDVLRAVEEGSVPEEVIKFGSEYVELFSWARRRQYSALKESLGTGVITHLQGNELLRQIFKLGAPVNQADVRRQKASRFERQMWNNAASKARTLSRGKNRDKRNASMY